MLIKCQRGLLIKYPSSVGQEYQFIKGGDQHSTVDGFSTLDPRYFPCGTSKVVSERIQLLSGLPGMSQGTHANCQGLVPLLRRLALEMKALILTCSPPFVHSCQYPKWLTLFAHSQLTSLADGGRNAHAAKTESLLTDYYILKDPFLSTLN